MTRILISEVGPRDGLQSIDRVMPLAAKKAWIKAEAEAGVREIEVGSFVPPSLLPQMADTAELVAFARTLPGLNVVALVPNAKGAARAVEAGVHGMSIPFSMSETHSRRNVRKDHAQMIEEIRAVAGIAQAAGVHFAVGLSTAFGCTIEGAVSEDQVVRLAEASVAAGAMELSLSDTTGYADPAQVKRLVRKVRAAGLTVDVEFRSPDHAVLYAKASRTVCRLDGTTHQPAAWSDEFRAKHEALVRT